MRPDASDFELLNAWGAGNAAAGRMLYERHFGLLYRFVRNKIDSGTEDLIQSVWLACVETRDRFRREGSFRAYLLQIARFQLYAHYRKRKRREDLDFSASSLADLGTSPSLVAQRHQQERALLEALRRVPLDHQIVLELRFWEELSGPEIAEVLGIPEPAVRSRLRRASERLRVELQALAAHGPALPDTDDDLQQWVVRLRELMADVQGAD
jgi:RNA polymerase sigma factor (sigma-70 family)